MRERQFCTVRERDNGVDRLKETVKKDKTNEITKKELKKEANKNVTRQVRKEIHLKKKRNRQREIYIYKELKYDLLGPIDFPPSPHRDRIHTPDNIPVAYSHAICFYLRFSSFISFRDILCKKNDALASYTTRKMYIRRKIICGIYDLFLQDPDPIFQFVFVFLFGFWFLFGRLESGSFFQDPIFFIYI